MNEQTTQDDALDFTDHSTPAVDPQTVCIKLDSKTLDFFHSHAELLSCEPQELMLQALQQYAEGHTLADIVRSTIREELAKQEQRFIL